MVCLLHNRRKYTREQTGPVTGGVWADFDLSKTGANVANVQIVDTASSYLSNQPLRCFNIAPMHDGSLLISAEGQGHGYVWGFSPGHSFELNYLNGFYTSRTGSFGSFYCIFFNSDGTAFYRQSGGNQCLYRQPLGSAYNIGTAGPSTTILNSYQQGLVTNPSYFFFSPDGKRVFYKGTSNDTMFCVSLDSAWPTDVPATWRLQAKVLANFNAAISGTTNTWNGFTFSPDGRCLIATTNMYVVKFVMSTPWDLSTMSLHSYKNLTNDVRSVAGDSSVSMTLTGVAVNDTGTKMIVHNRAGGTTAKCRFFEYNLVA